MTHILHQETGGTLSTQSGNWTPIPGLSITLPAVSGALNEALIILNVPNPYATGTDNPGGYFGISVDNAVLVPVACFTSFEKAPQSTGRVPTTLVVRIRLKNSDTQAINAVWQSVRSSNVIIDTPASLSAMIM